MSDGKLKRTKDGRFWLIDPKTGKKRNRPKGNPRTKSRIPDEKADESWLKRLSKGGVVKSSRKKSYSIYGIATRGKTKPKYF